MINPNSIKKPISAFFHYTQIQREKGVHIHLRHKARLKAIKKDWIKLPEEEKRIY